jgi:hypothetical protein
MEITLEDLDVDLILVGIWIPISTFEGNELQTYEN